MHQKELDIITFKHVCKDCNLAFGDSDDLLEHLVSEHRHRQPAKQYNRIYPKDIRSKEVEDCSNGPSCKYLQDNRCNFRHTELPWKTAKPRRQRQDIQKHKQEHNQNNKKQQDVCRNGYSCKYKKNNRCIFIHEEARKQHTNQSTRKTHSSSGQDKSESQSHLRPCKFGNRCNQGMSCDYLHLAKDFLPMKGGRRQ